LIYNCSKCGIKGKTSEENPISNTEIQCTCGNRIMLTICPDCKSSYTASISNINPGRYSFYCKKCPAKLFFYVGENLRAEPKVERPKEDYKRDYQEYYKPESLTSSYDEKLNALENVIREKHKETQTISRSDKSLLANFNYLVLGIIFSFGILVLETMLKSFGVYLFDVFNLSMGLTVLVLPLLIMLQLCIYISSYGYFRTPVSNSKDIMRIIGSIAVLPVLKIILCSLMISSLVFIVAKSVEFLPISNLTLFPVFLFVFYGVFLILSIIANGILWFYPCKLAFKNQKKSVNFTTFFDWCVFGFFLSGIMMFIFIVINFPTALVGHKFVIFKYSVAVFKYALAAIAFGFLFKLVGVFYYKIK